MSQRVVADVILAMALACGTPGLGFCQQQKHSTMEVEFLFQEVPLFSIAGKWGRIDCYDFARFSPDWGFTITLKARFDVSDPAHLVLDGAPQVSVQTKFKTATKVVADLLNESPKAGWEQTGGDMLFVREAPKIKIFHLDYGDEVNASIYFSLDSKSIAGKRCTARIDLALKGNGAFYAFVDCGSSEGDQGVLSWSSPPNLNQEYKVPADHVERVRQTRLHEGWRVSWRRID